MFNHGKVTEIAMMFSSDATTFHSVVVLSN
jgi:hypothetical protein